MVSVSRMAWTALLAAAAGCDSSSDNPGSQGGQGGVATDGGSAPLGGSPSHIGGTNHEGGSKQQGGSNVGASGAGGNTGEGGGGGEAPKVWTCEPERYNQAAAGVEYPACDCNCGIQDPDCDPQLGAFVLCGDLVGATGQVCVDGTCTPPPGWTCDTATFYETATGTATVACNCDCGVFDPDCLENAPIEGCAENQTCSGAGKCINPPPDEWHCLAGYYDEITAGYEDADCNCSCGAHDPDCDAQPDAPLYCGSSASEDGQTCVDGLCTAPTGWICAAAAFDEYATSTESFACDCNCGITDPDCDQGANLVNGCAEGETCNHNATCQPPAPQGWTCDPGHYSDGGVCDCGCGVLDSDCANSTPQACDYCDQPGSCVTVDLSCVGLDPENNAVCIPN